MNPLEIKNEIENNYVSTLEAAKIIGCTISAIQKMCERDALEGVIKIGQAWLIPRVVVENFTRRKVGRPKKKTERQTWKEFLSELESN